MLAASNRETNCPNRVELVQFLDEDLGVESAHGPGLEVTLNPRHLIIGDAGFLSILTTSGCNQLLRREMATLYRTLTV